jgi:hypothetical protein
MEQASYDIYLRYTLAGGKGLVIESIQQREAPNGALTTDTKATIQDIYSEIMTNNTDVYPTTKK